MPLEAAQQFGDEIGGEAVDPLGQAIGEQGRLRRQAGRVDDDAGVGQPGEFPQLVRIVPDDVEIGADLVDQDR